MKIPNVILSLTTGSTLKVACKLYSLIRNKKSRNGYEVCIKQTTLANACGLSLSTVQRAVTELVDKKIITNRYRITRKDGYQGAYHYSLAIFSNYFYLRYDVFKFSLTAQQFTLYATMCKLRTNGISSFYQSLNDLHRITGMDKRDICKICRYLIECGLIVKQRKRTKLGDYTDNTYFVIVRLRGTFKKKLPRFFTHIIAPLCTVVKGKFREIFKNPKNVKKRKNKAAFYFIRGSG
jgi:DNA-binding Lrp family transcriptional regulator